MRKIPKEAADENCFGRKIFKEATDESCFGVSLKSKSAMYGKAEKNFFIRIQHRQLYSKHRNQDSKINTIKPQKKKELIPIPVTRSKKYFTL